MIEARSAIGSRKEDYTRCRSPSALGDIAGREFATKSTLEKRAA